MTTGGLQVDAVGAAVRLLLGRVGRLRNRLVSRMLGMVIFRLIVAWEAVPGRELGLLAVQDCSAWRDHLRGERKLLAEENQGVFVLVKSLLSVAALVLRQVHLARDLLVLLLDLGVALPDVLLVRSDSIPVEGDALRNGSQVMIKVSDG